MKNHLMSVLLPIAGGVSGLVFGWRGLAGFMIGGVATVMYVEWRESHPRMP